jgi:flagellar hook protein FlgE
MMGLLQAISGLKAANTVIDIISNNISNASTIGFKSKNIVLTDLSSKKNKTEGIGVNILKTKSNIHSGEIFYTNRNLDLSINKNGFFRLLSKNGSIYYTRNGHFYINKNHYVVNSEGMYLTGYPINYSSLTFGDYGSKLIPINLSNYIKTTSQPTTILKFFITLNSLDHIKINRAFDKKITNTYNQKLKIKIIDSLGKERFLDFFFVKTADKIWQIHPYETNKHKKITPFKIEFDDNGHLISNKIIKIDTKLNINQKKENILLDLEKILQKKTTNNQNYFSQNGYTEGVIQNYEIDHNGTIYGLYSNQKKIPLSKIILSNFTNSENLKYEENSIFSKTNSSGIETTGMPGTLEFGKIISGGLEKSNVDLNKEFLNMIAAQRNYQSNVQVIKAEEKMFNTLINL